MPHVLVLNQDFTPLTVTSVEKAFLLLYLKKAELVADIKDRKLRTVRSTFPFPSVIKTNRYIPIPYKGIMLTRQNIFKRDNFRCQYCYTDKDLTLDHIIPRSKGGKSTWNNLVTACRPCNARKSDHDLETIDMKLLSKPRKPSLFLFIRNSRNIMQDIWLPYLESRNEVA